MLSIKELNTVDKLVLAFCEVEGIPERSALAISRAVFNDKINKLSKRNLFVLADAIGCNDLGLEITEDIQKIYEYAFATSLQS